MNTITAYAVLSKLIKTLTGVVTDFSYDSANKAIKLTTTTGTYSIPTSQIIVSSVKGDPGQDGKSAYEIAVDHGYSATEQSDIANLPTNVESTSTCQLITDSGLTVYMFRKTGEKTGKWVAI